MRLLRLALQNLWRDWRSGELTLIAAALLIAVGGSSAVGFFTSRIENALERQAGSLLAADLVVESGEPVQPALEAEARERGLALTRQLAFRSVVGAGGRLQLVELKAVAEGYPLRGVLELSDTPFGESRPAGGIPQPGTAWVDTRLLQLLEVAPGDTLEVGALRLRIERMLALEPDRGGDLFSIAPRLMMNLADIPASGLVLPGSRVTHRLMLAGAAEDVERVRSWVEPRLRANERLVSVRDGRPELRTALDRARQFLGLAALTSIVLAGVAIATAARRHAERHLDACAVLRCLGATQGRVLAIHALGLGMLGLGAGLLGVALGYGAHEVLARLLAGLSPGELPPPSALPALRGVLVALATLAGFALPPLMQLRDVPPIRVFRRDLGPPPVSSRLTYGAALAAIAALAPWETGQVHITGYVIGGSVLTALVLAALALLIVRLLGGLRGRVGVAWRYGLASVARRSRGSVTQIVALGLGIMVMLLLTVVRADLLENWRASLPPEAPNHFLINIQPAETEALTRFLTERGQARPTLYPMVRARLVAVNGKPVAPGDYLDQRAQRLVDREFNLAWMPGLPADNRIVAGRWWGETPAPGQFSVEDGIASTLGLALGDELTYRVADQEVSGRITSLRAVDWDSFNVNFFVVAPRELLEGFPATFLTSFHLGPADGGWLPELVRAFPSVTVLDVDALLSQVRAVIDRVTQAVQFVFVFTLGAGLVVLAAAVQATQDERVRETAVMRTLGAQSGTLVRGLLAEFGILGAAAGAVAAAAAYGIGHTLAAEVFGVGYAFNPWIAVGGLLGGVLGVGAVGLVGMRAALGERPARVLRRG